MSFLALTAGEINNDKVASLKDAIGTAPQNIPLQQIQSGKIINHPEPTNQTYSPSIHQTTEDNKEGFTSNIEYGSPYAPSVNFTQSTPINFEVAHTEVANNSVLLKKINYIIRMLEDEKDEKNESTTEDIIMFSLIGVFTIFAIDSFVRVGKYTR